VSASVVEAHTTVPGLVAAGLSVRLCVRLTADGPSDTPERIAIRMGQRLLTVMLDRA
jgi:hypothetical protein